MTNGKADMSLLVQHYGDAMQHTATTKKNRAKKHNGSSNRFFPPLGTGLRIAAIFTMSMVHLYIVSDAPAMVHLYRCTIA